MPRPASGARARVPGQRATLGRVAVPNVVSAPPVKNPGGVGLGRWSVNLGRADGSGVVSSVDGVVGAGGPVGPTGPSGARNPPAGPTPRAGADGEMTPPEPGGGETKPGPVVGIPGAVPPGTVTLDCPGTEPGGTSPGWPMIEAEGMRPVGVPDDVKVP